MLNRSKTITILIAMSVLLTAVTCSSSWALDSCEVERPSHVVRFTPGSSAPSLSLPPDSSDPTILLRPTSELESLRFGVGGSVVLKFTVPIANYPAAGGLTVERPQGALPCASHPVRAEISGSIDGEHFIPLGSTCETATFDLGPLPWVAYLRIQDVTNPSDAAFGSNAVGSFDLRSVSGPGCLKYSHCAVSPAPDTTVTNSSSISSLALSSIGEDFVFTEPASFEEYGNGTARLTGTVHRASDPTTAYDAIMSFAGRVKAPPTQSPFLELQRSAYSAQGGPVDPTSWHYYKQAAGMLFGKGSRRGEKIPLGNPLRPMQIGVGANGRDTTLGGAGIFSYGATDSDNSAELRVGLTSCSFPPTPQPHEPPPTCNTEDISKTLANLDTNLQGRVTIMNRATSLLVRHNRSRASVRFKTAARAKVHNLYALAWTDVWRHDRLILTCSPSVLCFDLHHEPTHASLAASARALDAAVSSSLRYIQKRTPSRNAQRALKELVRKHLLLQKSFIRELARLPAHSARCQ
jgi:hypothetical protein